MKPPPGRSREHFARNRNRNILARSLKFLVGNFRKKNRLKFSDFFVCDLAQVFVTLVETHPMRSLH